MELDHATNTPLASEPFSTLTRAQYIQLTTFRKTGVGVPTPVWFAISAGKVYVVTGASAGKLKRIRNNGRVTLAPCKSNGQVTGEAVEATASILTVTEQALANDALTRKYGWLYRIFAGFQRLRRRQQVFIEIQPV